MLIVTTDTVPGYEVRTIYGHVTGVGIRLHGADTSSSTTMRVSGSGEVPHLAGLMDTRREAVGRMVADAQQRGANVIIGMRFDTSEVAGKWTEVCAYGTAVRAEAARQQSQQGAWQAPQEPRAGEWPTSGQSMIAKDVTMGVRGRRGDPHS